MTAQEPDILKVGDELFEMEDIHIPEDKASIRPFGIKTSLYRGYIGEWEIKDNELWLVGFKEGGNLPNGPVKADWFTGTLSAWTGVLLEYVHAGYASLYETNVKFKIKEGNVLYREDIDNVPEYKEWVFKEIRNSGNLERTKEHFLGERGGVKKLAEKYEFGDLGKRFEYKTFKEEVEAEITKQMYEEEQNPKLVVPSTYWK